jgi:hypothetical protein
MPQCSAGRPLPTAPHSENKEFREACKARNPIKDETKAAVPGEGEEELSQARHKVSGGGQATQALRIMQFILTYGADMATRRFRSCTAPSGCLWTAGLR